MESLYSKNVYLLLDAKILLMSVPVIRPRNPVARRRRVVDLLLLDDGVLRRGFVRVVRSPGSRWRRSCRGRGGFRPRYVDRRRLLPAEEAERIEPIYESMRAIIL